MDYFEAEGGPGTGGGTHADGIGFVIGVGSAGHHEAFAGGTELPEVATAIGRHVDFFVVVDLEGCTVLRSGRERALHHPAELACVVVGEQLFLPGFVSGLGGGFKRFAGSGEAGNDAVHRGLLLGSRQGHHAAPGF